MRRWALEPELRAFGPGRSDAPPEGPHPRTSLRISPKGPVHLSAHLSRLQESAGREVPWLHGIVESLFDWATGAEAVLRLALDLDAEVLWARKEPLPITPHPYLLLPRLHPLRHIDAPRAKGLAGRWEGPVLESVHAAGATDALLHWEDGTVAETAIATLGLERNGVLRLPPCGGRVRSLGERLLLPEWLRAQDLRLEEGPIPMADVRAGRLWCVNAVRGIWEAELHPTARSADGVL